MPARKRCDRCGKVYTINEGHRATSGAILAGVSLFDIDDEAQQTYDLCDKCLKRFFKFMTRPLRKNAKKNKK